MCVCVFEIGGMVKEYLFSFGNEYNNSDVSLRKMVIISTILVKDYSEIPLTFVTVSPSGP